MPKRVVRRRVRRRPTPAVPARRRRLAPLTALLALGTAGAVVAAVLVVGGGTRAVQVSERTATVSHGVVQTIVSGSGNLAPARQQDVDFSTSGRITHVYVHTGERLDIGDLIARVDSSTQRVAVDKAQADLDDAEDALTRAQEAAAAATPTPTPQTTAAVAVAAQATPGARPTATPAPTRTPRPTPAPTASAGRSSGSTQSVASAQAGVESAQLALKQAEDDLDATELRAPMPGTVAELNGAVGDMAGSSSSSSGSDGFVVLADLHRLKLDVSLSESDIGKVHKGQSATVTVNAASGEKVSAHVSSVSVLASSSSTGSGAVSYPVEVTLEQRASGVKPGMSATADIVVAQASGLVVPSQALRGDTVTVQRDGRRSTQTVQTGVVGDSDTQIVAGLKAGDQVIVTSTAATLGAAASRASRNGRFGGGFGPGAGFRGAAGLGPRVVVGGP